MTRTSLFALALMASLTFACPVSASMVIYDQPYNGNPNILYASQLDPGGYGLFATAYDNFSVASPATVDSIEWTGGYFNGSPSPVTSFDLGFYADNAGQPGALITNYVFPSGNFAVTPNADGTVFYAVNLPAGFNLTPGTTYWFSPVPTMQFPPQWGWATSDVGDGTAIQDFLGARNQLNANFAFTLRSNAVPEPASFILAGMGLAAMAVFRAHRKRVS